MHSRVIVVAFVILIGLGGVAQAEMFGGGPVYGGTASIGGQITCRIFNYGVSSVSISTRQIWNNTNPVAPEPLVGDTCNVVLAPTKYCAFTANIPGNLAYSCRVIATGIDVKLSGVAEVKNPASSVILNSVPIGK